MGGTSRSHKQKVTQAKISRVSIIIRADLQVTSRLSHSRASLLMTGSTAAWSCTCSCLIAPPLVLQAWKNKTGLVTRQPSSPLHQLFFSQASYLQTLSTSLNKSTKKKKKTKFVMKTPACNMLYQSVTQQLVFIGAPDTQWAFQPASVCITGHFRIDVARKSQAPPSPDSFPTSHRLCGAGSLTRISLSFHRSSVMKLQSWQWMWMTSEFSELGELPEITPFINSLN